MNQSIDEDLLELLKKMLIVNDNERISWEEVFVHPIFQKEISNLNFHYQNFNLQQF